MESLPCLLGAVSARHLLALSHVQLDSSPGHSPFFIDISTRPCLLDSRVLLGPFPPCEVLAACTHPPAPAFSFATRAQ